MNISGAAAVPDRLLPSSPSVARPDAIGLDRLRAEIERLSGRGGGTAVWRRVTPTGLAAIDAALPGEGLLAGGIHELLGDEASAAATGFAAILLARLAGPQAMVLWCRHGRGLYGPALAAFGVDLARLLLVDARNDREILWAAEEGLRSGTIPAVVVEIAMLPTLARRRLQLAAERGGSTGLLLRSTGSKETASSGATLSRWRIAALPSAGPSPDSSRLRPCWRVELAHCRTRPPAVWRIRLSDERRRFALVAELLDRPAVAAKPPARRLG